MLRLVKDHFSGRLAEALTKSEQAASSSSTPGAAGISTSSHRISVGPARGSWWQNLLFCRGRTRRSSAPISASSFSTAGAAPPQLQRPAGSKGRRPLLLAIGDGANDVAMIQAADVGVGIAGKEGRQAVNNADFAVGQFRFLGRLLLLHGTLSHYRIARLIKCAGSIIAGARACHDSRIPTFDTTCTSFSRYSFYKNIIFSNLLFFYQFYCGFSGQALYDSVSAGVYNVFLTSLPIIVFSLFDKPVSNETLATVPQVYNKSTSLTPGAFWKSIWDSVVHSAICFFLTLYSVRLVRVGASRCWCGLPGTRALPLTPPRVALPPRSDDCEHGRRRRPGGPADRGQDRLHRRALHSHG